MTVKVTSRPAKAKTAGPQILVFDIETSPMQAYVWGCFKQYIAPSQLITTSEVLCFSAKWLGEDTVFFDSQQKDDNDERLCGVIWELIDRADVVIAHNGKAFDEKTMNARWVRWRKEPPSPYRSVDTCILAKKQFRFPRAKLENIAMYLEKGRKLEHEGFRLWVKCLHGDRAAWDRMKKYNIQDTLLLEDVYMELRPWDKRHPNIGLMYDDGDGPNKARCVCCGSTALKQLTKPTRTAVSEFPTFRCKSCGKVMRSRKRMKQEWGKEDHPLTNVQ